MKLVAMDFETYYDSKTYSLSKMTVPEYVLDPRFELIGCAVKVPEWPEPFFMEGGEFREWLAAETEPLFIVSHNSLFDMSVLRWRCGYTPAMMADTLGMSRAMLAPFITSMSLKSVADFLGLGEKGDAIVKVDGMSGAVIKSAGLWASYADYAKTDAELCLGIFTELLRRGFPREELRIMDMVLRCATELRFELDLDILLLHLAEVRAQKQQLLDSVGMSDRDALMSNDKFADVLRSLGVDPPMKASFRTGKETYAFSKTDPEFIALQDHENPAVQAMVAARLGLKSTLEETRTERMVQWAQLQWPTKRPSMPIPLRYSGAHTHRLSGDWSINVQNFPRGGKLRKALKAPSGKRVVTRDSSQIEARMTACFAGQDDLVAAFDRGDDIYAQFASDVFGFPVNKKTHPVERFIGKTAILGLGYGMGWRKFMDTILVQSRNQLGQEIRLTEEEAKRIVNLYRQKYRQIALLWRWLNDSAIPHMAFTEHNQGGLIKAPVTFLRQRCKLPNGMYLYYHDLNKRVLGSNGQYEWTFKYGRENKRLFGGKLLENIIQALARIVVMDAASRTVTRLVNAYPELKKFVPDLEIADLQLAMQVHDEIIFVVPEAIADFVDKVMEQEMSKRPKWMPNLPLASEGGIGENYGEAK